MSAPLAVQPVKYEAVPVKGASRREIPTKKVPVSGMLKTKVTPKAIKRNVKVKLEAAGPSKEQLDFKSVEAPRFNMTTTAELPYTALGYPRNYPRNSINSVAKQQKGKVK